MFAGIVEKLRAAEAEAKAKAEADQVARYNLWKKPAATPDSMATPITPWDAQREASDINARKPKTETVSGRGGLINRYLAR